MIIVSKCPYRVSLLGGGSDLDWFVETENYGISLGYPINKYSYIVINKLEKIAKEGIINYSTRETYKSFSDIAHPLIKATFEYFQIEDLLEINSLGFAAGGSGLGGSSSFLIALIYGISQLKPDFINPDKIPFYACDIEINKLNKPIGRQDQYLCSSKDISCFKYKKNGIVEQLFLSKSQLNAVRKSTNTMYLIPTNIMRSADLVLQKLKDEQSNLSKIKDLRLLLDTFLKEDKSSEDYCFESFNNAVKESWRIKKSMTGVINNEIEKKLNQLNKCPNYWIRLVGAGAGGFFLLSSQLDHKTTCQTLISLGFKYFFKPELDKNGPLTLNF